jgi:hypothetical protein
MRQELEVAKELKRVRDLLKEYRANKWDEDMLYGAQQALVWVMEQGISPSELEETIQFVAEYLENQNAETP